jgi:hypothetical protein
MAGQNCLFSGDGGIFFDTAFMERYHGNGIAKKVFQKIKILLLEIFDPK